MAQNQESLQNQLYTKMAAVEDGLNFCKLTESYLDAFSLARSSNPSIIEIFDKFLPIATGFNYAFDDYWMLPFAKYIYTTFIWTAFQADKLLGNSGSSPTKVKAACIPLDALRGKMFDRSAFPATRKLGIIFTANLIFKCYLNLNNLSQLQKVLDYVYNHVLQDESLVNVHFSKSEQCSFYFYVGKFRLLQHNIPSAIDYLSKAFLLCHRMHHKNKRMILIYLVTAKIVMGQYPARFDSSLSDLEYPLLHRYQLSHLIPLITCIKQGNIGAFESFIAQNKNFLLHHHLYTVLYWRCTLQIYRNLVKHVYIIGSSIETSGTLGYSSDTTPQLQQGNSISMDTEASKPPRITFKDVAIALVYAKDPLYFSRTQVGENQSPNFSEVEIKSSAINNSILALLTRLSEAGMIKGNVVPANSLMVVSRKQAFPVLNGAMLRLAEKEGWWRPKGGDSRQIVEEDED